MSDLAQERALRPIYNHLDSYNYSKALKLTYTQPLSKWPITIALRAHCLERSGRKLDACREIRILTSALSNQNGGSGDWSELDEMIWLLGLGSEGETSTVGTNKATSSEGGGKSSSSASSGNSGSSSRGKGKKGKGKSSTATKVSNSGSASSNAASQAKSPLDMIHILDLPKYKVQEILSSSKFVENSFVLGKDQFKPQEIADETVIATMAVTLHALRLYHTLANLYSKCIAVLTPTNVKLNQLQREQLCTLLIQGYQSQLKWIATQRYPHSACSSSISTGNNNNDNNICSKKRDDEIHSARCVLLAWEEAQLIAMSLVKYSGNCTLYKSWCAFATIQHWKSSKILLNFLLDSGKEDEVVIEEERKKLEQKVTVLPRLAEMLIQGVCSTGKNNDKDKVRDGEFPPSADDWRIFKECLVSQAKYSDVIDVLSNVRCGTEKEGRQIHDENDVKHHLGSLIQLSERERIEIIADMNVKLDKCDVATSLYFEKLLEMSPDQWSYWNSLISYSLRHHNQDYDAAFEECNTYLQHVLEKQDRLQAEGKASRVPLRGPNLFPLSMVAEGIRSCGTNDIASLSKAIEAYGNLFASQVSCCFQDLRPYIELLVTKSSICQEGDTLISNEVIQLTNWAKSIREANNLHSQSGEDKTEQSENQKKERRSKLRVYIFSVKITFELWYQSLSKIDWNDVDKRSVIDDTMMKYLPSVDELVKLWENVLDLGSNPNDGGQKETLPGDDLILLASQLIIHQSHQQPLTEKVSFCLLAATLLEKAINESPYNPYLKIAAINIYVANSVTTRAWELFNELKVAHIQLDSCSYIILRHLLSGGLYSEAIGQAGQIINLHSSSAKDVSKFMPKAFENGNLTKGFEMISWQRYEMNHSIQLLEAKSIVMDLAPLFTVIEMMFPKMSSPAIGAYHGISGVKDTDITRAEKIVRDSSNFYAAPSLIGLSNYDQNDNNGNESTYDSSWSDNRDLTVNEYEILERTNHEVFTDQSISSAHIHSILTRVILLLNVTKPLKKGKVVKYKIGDDLDIRVKSVLQSVKKAKAFINKSRHLSSVHTALWGAKLSLCQSICVLGAGIASMEDTDCDSKPPSDTLATRETKCTEVLNKANNQIKAAIEAWKLVMNKIRDANEAEKLKFVCKLLPESLVPTYVLVRTAANLFGLFNWGKRKRNTKVAVGALANTALSLKDLIKEISGEFLKDLPQSKEDTLYQNHTLTLKSTVTELISSMLPHSSPLILSADGSKGIVDQVTENKALHRLILRRRLEPFFDEMINELDSFDVSD